MTPKETCPLCGKWWYGGSYVEGTRCSHSDEEWRRYNAHCEPELVSKKSRKKQRALSDKALIRAGVNILLEKIAQKFDGWETHDIWRSDAAMVVRGFKHPPANV